MRSATLLLTLLLAGCATERYGRVQHVGPTEQAQLSCEQIDVELGKTADFLHQTFAAKEPVSAADALAWMGDLGIGNSLEYEAALKSGQTRCTELVQLRIIRQCGGRFPPVDTKYGDGKVQRALRACTT